MIEKKVFSMLPTMVGMAFMQQMAGMNGGAGNRVHGENGATQSSGVAASVNKDERSRNEDFKQQTKQLEVVTEEDDVEENEFLDTDLF